MSAPRIEVDLSKIRHNTRLLVKRLKVRGIGVTGVTKAVCGHPAIAQAMLDGGATGLAESRTRNVQRLRQAGMTAPICMIRAPMLSQAHDIVQYCDASYNTEMDVIAALAAAALKAGTVHDVILLVEMGDMRDGILPHNIAFVAQQVIKMEGVALKGIGANFACFSGLVPDVATMESLSALAIGTEGRCGPSFGVVSGGNSANLPWAVRTHDTGRVNDLRLGEALLLGVDPVTGNQIDGLYTDAFTLFAEVIESKIKPESQPISAADATTDRIRLVPDLETETRSVLALGNQDTDIKGLSMPLGAGFLGATGDHLVVQMAHAPLRVGTELKFQMNYSALMRAMAAPDIETTLLKQPPLSKFHGVKPSTINLALI